MPYENLTSALLFGGYLKNQWGFSVPSMQSIWYGQTGNIFDPVQAEELLDYTAEAFQFAHSLNCPSLVFGCPKNRMRPLGPRAPRAQGPQPPDRCRDHHRGFQAARLQGRQGSEGRRSVT